MSLQVFSVKLNSYELNQQSSGIYLNSVDGLGALGVRLVGDEYSGRDGGFVSGKYFGRRTVSISGRIFDVDAAGAEQKRIDLLSALKDKDITLTITTYSGKQYFLETVLVSVRGLQFENDKNSYKFLVQLMSPDPFIYDTALDQSVVVNRYVSDGYPTPYTLPVAWGNAVSGSVANNFGNSNFYPTIELNDDLTNPKIINATTGKFIKLNITTVSGDKITIDNKNRTIKLNNGSILNLMTSDSNWIEIIPGNNEFQLFTDSAGDTGNAVVLWRNTYLGI